MPDPILVVCFVHALRLATGDRVPLWLETWPITYRSRFQA
jgi:hypothetical protein